MPGVGENFSYRPDQPRSPLSLLYNGYRLFPEGKAAGTQCRPSHLFLVPVYTLVSPPPLCAYIGMSWGDLHLNREIWIPQCSWLMSMVIFRVESYRQKVDGADMEVGPHFGARRCVHDRSCRCWSCCVQEEKRGEQLGRDNCSVLYCKKLIWSISSNWQPSIVVSKLSVRTS